MVSEPMNVKLTSVALALLCYPLGAAADSWPAPSSLGKSSANGSYMVRVTPGTSKSDFIGYSGEPKGPYAVAECKGGSCAR